MKELKITYTDTDNKKLPTYKDYNTSVWTIADALKVKTDDLTTSMPLISYDFPTMDESIMVWDSGALRNIHGLTVTFKGWYVMWSLVANKVDLTNKNIYTEWHNRNNVAYIGYWYSKDGVEWKFGGRLLNKSADLRPWEWSGGLVMREGKENIVDMFYTSVSGEPSESVVSVSSGKILADKDGVWFEGFDKTTEMFQADGVHYANINEDQYFDFRDPHPFINPNDGQVYCLFEGNVAGMRGSFSLTDKETGILPPNYSVDPGAKYGAAAIGIAKLKSSYADGDFSEWEMLPPLVTALGVNDQTERPHIVFKDGYTYLFTISHHSTYSGNLQGPDGVYGFVSKDGLFGNYKPMNSSGLVLGNHSSQPYGTYSHFVDMEGYVQSFIDTIPASGQDYQNPSEYRIGGTLAPTVKIELKEDRSFISEVLNYAQIFAQKKYLDNYTYDSRS